MKPMKRNRITSGPSMFSSLRCTMGRAGLADRDVPQERGAETDKPSCKGKSDQAARYTQL
jgi:hypothetical protein